MINIQINRIYNKFRLSLRFVLNMMSLFTHKNNYSVISYVTVRYRCTYMCVCVLRSIEDNDAS